MVRVSWVLILLRTNILITIYLRLIFKYKFIRELYLKDYFLGDENLVFLSCFQGGERGWIEESEN